jgi:hypothetical protein
MKQQQQDQAQQAEATWKQDSSALILSNSSVDISSNRLYLYGVL